MTGPKMQPSPTQLDLLSSVTLPTEPCSPELGQMDILLDGYISHTLTPLYAEIYLKLFIKCLERKWNVSLVEQDAGWVVVCSRTAQVLHQLQHQLQHQPSKQKRLFERLHWHRPFPTPPPTPRPVLVKHHQHDALPHRSCQVAFDYKVDLYRGTIVPQPTWIGVKEATGVYSPIFFLQRDGTLGVPYKQCGVARGLLRDPMAPASELFRRSNQNVRIRIQWPGYKEFHYEFRILDRKLDKQVPIETFRVVERVARGLHRLHLEGKREEDPDKLYEHWKFREDHGILIHLDEINIIGLLHISRGTWVPILQLDRHIIPRFKERKEKPHEDPTGEGACGSPPLVDEEGPVLPKGKERRKEGKPRSQQ